MSSGVDRLRIARLEAVYLAAECHPSPELLARRLDDVVRKELPSALRAMLANLAKSSDPTLWFIRRLEVPVDVNAAWESEAIARSWAREISRVLASDLCGAGDGVNVIRFPDRAAYLARFILDAASGDAWNHWIYRSFEGLRALPISVAIRTALVDDAALGLIALQRLALPELATVVGALGEVDAKRTVSALAADHDANSLDQAFAAAVAQWPSIAAACDVLSVPRTALTLFVRLTTSGAGGRSARVAAEAIAALAAIVRTHPTASQLRNAVAAAIPAAAGHRRAVDIRSTRFGGAMLFLPLLDALQLDAVASDWPALSGTNAAQMLRWLVLVKCLGRPRVDAAFHDPALRDLFRIAPEIGWPETATWLVALGNARRRALTRAVTHDAASGATAAADLDYLALPRLTGIDPIWKRVLTFGAQRVMRKFAQHLPGFAQSRYAYLHRNLLDFAATLECEPDRIVVRVGRPPLHLMLSLIGASRGTMQFAWLDPRPLALFSED